MTKTTEIKVPYTVTSDCTEIKWERLCELFEVIGWGKRNEEAVKISFEKSKYKIFIWDADQLIGFGRTVDDGTYYALIVDVIVDPNYQGKRIGSQIVSNLKDQLMKDGFLFITLTAAIGKEDFYKKLGWRQQTSAYIWPRDEKQAELHSK